MSFKDDVIEEQCKKLGKAIQKAHSGEKRSLKDLVNFVVAGTELKGDLEQVVFIALWTIV